jgi:hypothetical protein
MLYYDPQVSQLVAEERVADLRRSIGPSRRDAGLGRRVANATARLVSRTPEPDCYEKPHVVAG